MLFRSRNVRRDFGYPSLFDKARRDGAPGSLASADRDLFEVLDTQNFERALAEIRMAEALGQDPRPFLARYQSIQQALGRAVQSVHVGYYEIPKATQQAIGRVLQGQEYVFTTSYDLVVYWAMGAVDCKGCVTASGTTTASTWRTRSRRRTRRRSTSCTALCTSW